MTARVCGFNPSVEAECSVVAINDFGYKSNYSKMNGVTPCGSTYQLIPILHLL